MSFPSVSDSENEAIFNYQKSKEFGQAYRNDGDPASLTSAIHHAEKAVNLTTKSPRRYLDFVDFVLVLGYYLAQRYNILEDPADLERSIALYRAWLEEAPTKHEKLPLVLCLLSGRLGLRFKYTNDRHELDESLELAHQALSLSELDPSLHLTYLRTVEEQLRRIHENFGELDVLDRLIQARRDVLEESTKRNESQMWRDVDDLGRGLFARFKQTSTSEDLQEALPLAKKVCQLMPEGFPHGCNAFSHLSSVLAQCYEAGILPLSSLDESIEVLHTAMRICPSGSHDRLGLLVNLMNRNREVFEHGRGIRYLHSAIEYGKEAVSLTALDDPERPNRYQNLAVCFKVLFEHSGQRNLLDEVIDTYRKALSSTGSSNEDKAMIASNLSIALNNRYETSAATEDIVEAISKARQAVSWVSSEHYLYAIYANTLGNMLSARYERFKNIKDLDEAISWAREAEHSSRDRGDNRDYGMFLSNISTKLKKRYEATGSEEDWVECITLARSAVEVTPNTNPSKLAAYTNNLAVLTYESYLRTKEDEYPLVEELKESLNLSRVCVDIVPSTHIDWSDYTYWLGRRQMELASIASDVDSGWAQWDQAVETILSAFRGEGASPSQKLRAGRAVTLMQMSRGRWTEANTVSKEILTLLSHVSPRSVSRGDMQHRLSGLSNISTFAAVASLNSGESPEEAFALLEMGRGLISGLLISSRTDVSYLDTINPTISKEYQQIREELFQSPKTVCSGDVVRYREERTKRLARLENEIRRLPGLSRFQLPASGDQLKELASLGPIVCFNVTKFRSDAFIVTSDKIATLPLPLLLEEDLEARVQLIVGKNRLTRCRLSKRDQSNKQLGDILVWLWKVAVEPVLDYLGFAGQTDANELPRLWWITSGLMGLMPLHAAGSGWDVNFQNTSSRVVSSYVHTLKALAHSREKSQTRTQKPSSILAAHNPHTPGEGWADLNTGPEIHAISTSAALSQVPVTVLEQPTVDEVITNMRRHNIVHLACHGDPDSNDPSQTSLVLSKDEKTADRMTVAQLFDEDHQHAQLAYLSACCTAQQYSLGLIDEGIHLGSVFQLMAFPAVIATLWEADDRAAADLAAVFYRELLQRAGAGKLGDSARCLHEAVRALRQQKLGRRKRVSEDIIAWAPFIHIGA